jgi:hypothetical protein
MNLFDLGELEQSVRNLRLLSQDRSDIDESTNVPLHLALRMIVSFDQFPRPLNRNLRNSI